ncbi:MAG: prolyl oligopeptidase family serine peptidase [Spirochaetales bacterium]|nr:prolyl oligopeptidase family serine peptidase [Spirochaetales bacterium]
MKSVMVFISVSMFILLIALSCSGGASVRGDEVNVIEKTLQELRDEGVSETDEGMLIVKRYQFYLSELSQGKAYMDWRQNSNPPIYNATVFLRLMDQEIIRKIARNTINGKDAFTGITGFFERAYISDVDNTIDSYIIYIPHSFNSSKEYPLVVNLHGYGDSAHLNPYSPAHLQLLKACEQREVIMVAPCGRQKLPIQQGLYVGDAETDVLQVLSLVKKYYPIDEKRVYLTGNSMGGFGSYWIASRHPDLIAAIAPVCGIWSGILGFPRVDLDALKEIPVLLFHNDRDGVVPVSESRSAYEYLKKTGGEVEYREITISKQDLWDSRLFNGHNAWDFAYEGTTLIDWLLQFSK